jgi:polysaccharide export outer membrane protein
VSNEWIRVVLAVGLLAPAYAQKSSGATGGLVPSERTGDAKRATYLLGLDDQMSIWIAGLDDLQGKMVGVDKTGYVSLPLIGRVRAAGLSIERFEASLVEGYRVYIREPQIAVSLVESRSQPVSVVGAVNAPGAYQLQGGHTLLEMITKAGGLKANSASFVKVMRPVDSGPITLDGANEDPSGQFYLAEVNIKALMASSSSKENIVLQPHDIVTVPEAQMVYVVGEVNKPGGYAATEGQQLTVLQVLSMAGGLTRNASPKNAKILHLVMGGPKRAEIPVNMKEMLSGPSHDMPLIPEDILVVPDSTGRKITTRAIEIAIQTGTYALTWGVIAPH